MRILAVLSVVALTAACSVMPAADHSTTTGSGKYEYSLVEEGSPETTNKNTYEALGDMLFTRTQKYKLVAQSDPARKPHFLIISVTKSIGKKVVERDQVATVFVQDGSYEVDCDHQYDVKISAGEDSVDDPRCSVKLLGVLLPDASATLVKS